MSGLAWATRPAELPSLRENDDYFIGCSMLAVLAKAYFRKLTTAGVPAYSRTVNGTCHGGDGLFRQAMPEVYAATIRDINGFANSL